MYAIIYSIEYLSLSIGIDWRKDRCAMVAARLYMGRLFEEDVLGRSRWQWSEYVPWRQCLEQVRKFQPFQSDPRNPSRPIPRALRNLVATHLGKRGADLRFFTAIGTPFDRFHRVDAFFEIDNAIVTVGLSLDPKKDAEAHRTSFVLHEEDVFAESGEINVGRLAEVAADIAAEITSQVGY